MSKRTWNKEELRKICEENISLRSVLMSLGIKPAGGNYATLKAYIKKFNIDTSHWLGGAYLRGKTHNWGISKPLTEICLEGVTTNSNKLKIKLIKASLLKNKCAGVGCEISDEWIGKPLVLHLDHINGVNTDNRIENLRLLCPNCHSQTSTYCGRNKKTKLAKSAA